MDLDLGIIRTSIDILAVDAAAGSAALPIPQQPTAPLQSTAQFGLYFPSKRAKAMMVGRIMYGLVKGEYSTTPVGLSVTC